MATGWRCGAVGDYTGGDSREASIAWKALDYEYRELGNDETENVARFLGIPPTSWKDVIAEFRRRYPNTRGIWLSRSKKESKLYHEYGEPEPVQYDKKNVIIDLGGDGIFVLQSEALPADVYEFNSGPDWQPVCAVCQQPITGSGIEVAQRGGPSKYYCAEHYPGQLKRRVKYTAGKAGKKAQTAPATLRSLR